MKVSLVSAKRDSLWICRYKHCLLLHVTACLCYSLSFKGVGGDSVSYPNLAGAGMLIDRETVRGWNDERVKVGGRCKGKEGDCYFNGVARLSIFLATLRIERRGDLCYRRYYHDHPGIVR